VKSKISDDIIIQKMNQSICLFNTSIDSLIFLKENLVSDKLIEIMMTKKSNTQGLANQTEVDILNLKETGIYFKNASSFIALDPTIATSSMPKNNLTNIKYKTQIEGSEANYQIKDSLLVFYFHFEPVKKNLSDANANATNKAEGNYLDQIFKQQIDYNLNNNNYKAASPNDFRLIKLDKTKNKREFTSGKMNLAGNFDFSVDDKVIIVFKYEKIAESTYKVWFTKRLKNGEYCFYYIGNNTNQSAFRIYGQNNFKVFDFGVLTE